MFQLFINSCRLVAHWGRWGCNVSCGGGGGGGSGGSGGGGGGECGSDGGSGSGGGVTLVVVTVVAGVVVMVVMVVVVVVMVVGVVVIMVRYKYTCLHITHSIYSCLYAFLSILIFKSVNIYVIVILVESFHPGS